MPRLFKENDTSRGDSGSMSLQVWMENGEVRYQSGKPVVGRAIRVGTPFGRAYSSQDWWQTSLVTEILEERKDYVKFRTHSGSIYIWEA
jgi:hypothetical protein